MKYLPACCFYIGVAFAVSVGVYYTNSAYPLWGLLVMGMVNFKWSH